MKTRILLTLLAAAASLSAASPVVVTSQAGPGDFPLATEGGAADLLVDEADFKVVRIAADCLAGDVGLVTGRTPRVRTDAGGGSNPAVIIGTLGKSRLIDKLVRDGRIPAAGMSGKWESDLIATVKDPLPGVGSALVIAGSDRRGTAYGMFSLSEAIGVSPWVWWADVLPDKRAVLAVKPLLHTQGPPSVKYRGIFINDEDWGMQPWSAKTLEPETGDIGPKTYARVGELLLRLKANLLWPAMHECTRAFNSIPENKRVADDYAIVMGSSHAEPMLFNNASEWTLPKNQWNYETHADDIRAVWEKRLKENGGFENFYTIGIRGIHDSRMQGGGTLPERTARVERVFADQRDLIARHVNPKIAEVPQVFVPYKEVLPLYQNNMRVPDDVTLMWVDDNHGYIRQLSTPEEQKRSGGAGVYYHHSYWGEPEDYLWLGSTSLGLTWSEMHKAWEQGARTVWVVNVGDIKPLEIGTEFFLRIAHDVDAFGPDAQTVFLRDWASREFGKERGPEIAGIMDRFYRLHQHSKPEHLHLMRFTNAYGEIGRRREAFAALVDEVNGIYQKLPENRKDAFHEMVVYPVRGAALANTMNWSADFSEATKAYHRLQEETAFFNEKVAGGKWLHMMSSNPRKRPALRKPEEAAIRARAEAAGTGPAEDRTSIALEAEQPVRSSAGKSAAAWKTIAGLGRSGDSVALLPTTAKDTRSASLEYEFTAPEEGPVRILVDCVPTHPLHAGLGVRYSVSVDGGPPQEVDLATKEYDSRWKQNVINSAATGITGHKLSTPGTHTLVIRPLDPGLVFDRIVIDSGDLKPSQLGPQPAVIQSR